MPKNSGEKQGRGRPPFKPTPKMRYDVSIAAGGGMHHEDIALAFGIHVDTLRKYFETELSVVAAQRRLEALKGVHKAAKRGSSSAAKVYLANEPHVAVPPAEKSGPEAKQPKLGKKEQAQADAVNAGKDTEWGEILPKHGATIQ